jgi:hypothetical protein
MDTFFLAKVKAMLVETNKDGGDNNATPQQPGEDQANE